MTTKPKFDASFKAYTDAVNMLHSAARMAYSVEDGEQALRFVKMLKPHIEAFEKAAYDD